MVYFILQESPLKTLQDRSSRSPKSDFLFPQDPAKPCQVVFYGGEGGSLRCGKFGEALILFTVFGMGHVYENVTA